MTSIAFMWLGAVCILTAQILAGIALNDQGAVSRTTLQLLGLTVVTIVILVALAL